jgi:hypothetical protein
MYHFTILHIYHCKKLYSTATKRQLSKKITVLVKRSSLLRPLSLLQVSINLLELETSGLNYKSFTIVMYDRSASGQYYKTMIMIIIYDHS